MRFAKRPARDGRAEHAFVDGNLLARQAPHACHYAFGDHYSHSRNGRPGDGLVEVRESGCNLSEAKAPPEIAGAGSLAVDGCSLVAFVSCRGKIRAGA